MDNKSICMVVVLAPMLLACGGGGGGTATDSAAVPAPLAALRALQALHKPADVALAWTAPSARADGSSLTVDAILGYQICYVSSDGRINLVDVPGSLQTDWVLLDLEPDNYQFNVFTYDSENNVSYPSSTVALSIDTFPLL